MATSRVRVDPMVQPMGNRIVIEGLGRAEAAGLSESIESLINDGDTLVSLEAPIEVVAELTP